MAVWLFERRQSQHEWLAHNARPLPIAHPMVELRLQGYSLDEIADATGRNERAVRRVMEEVGEFLKQRCLEFAD